jgi:hypothetical protein
LIASRIIALMKQVVSMQDSTSIYGASFSDSQVIASLKEVHERGDQYSPKASKVSIEEVELSHPKDILQLTHSPKGAIRALLARPPSSYSSSSSIDPHSPLIIIGRLDNSDALLCVPHTYATISSDRRGGNGSKVEVSASIGRVSDMMSHDAVDGSSSNQSARHSRISLLSYLPQSDASSPISHRDALGPRTDAPVRHKNRLPRFSFGKASRAIVLCRIISLLSERFSCVSRECVTREISRLPEKLQVKPLPQ